MVLKAEVVLVIAAKAQAVSSVAGSIDDTSSCDNSYRSIVEMTLHVNSYGLIIVANSSDIFSINDCINFSFSGTSSVEGSI